MTNFSELVMLFEIATINHFPFQNAFLWMLVNFEAPDDFMKNLEKKMKKMVEKIVKSAGAS